MSERGVLVRMEAEVSKFVQGMVKAEKATEQARKAQEDLGRAADDAAKKQEKSSDKAAQEIADLAKAHQAAAKAAGLHYDSMGRLVDGNKRVLNSAQATAHGLESFSEAVYKAGFKAEQAGEAQRRASEAAEKAAEQAEKAAARRADAAREAGQGLLVFGTASVAALGASAKAAMDWESAWAGVTKTVDGTPEQMAELESELRGLAKTLPLSHTEIAAVAEAAGQLGVKREDVAAFTKTMIDLGETTNLTADEAATNIAQIANVMGTAGADVDNFGATLVALGNDGASTEKEILDMAQRIAGAGKLVGASESDVLALSNALASVGIESQLGGGVISRVLQRMYADVKTGGKGLQELAEVAGVSSKEFAAAFEADPIRAMDMMVQGLSAVKDSGGNVVQTMEDLGIKGTEETSVILRMAGAGDLLTRSLDLGAKAWKQNTALAQEAEKRYATTESKVAVAWNNIKDAAIDAGAVLLPIIQSLAEGAAGLAQGFDSLPQPVQSVLTVVAAGAGAAALAGGGLLNLLPKIRDAKDAYAVLAPAGSKTNAVLSRTGRIASGAATGLAALGAAATLAKPLLDEVMKPTGETGDALQKFGGQAAQGAIGADTLNKSFQDLVQHQDGVSDFQQAINGIADPGLWGNIDNILVGTIRTVSLGMADVSSTSEKARERFKEMGQQLATLDAESANKAFRSMAASTDGSQQSLERLLEFMPEYRRSLEEQAKASGKGTDTQSLLKIAMDDSGNAAQTAADKQALLDKAIHETGVSIEGVVEDMDKFLEQLFQAGVLTMNSRDAQAAYQEQLDGVAGTLQKITDSGGEMGATLNKNRTDFDLTTEAGRLANETFQGLASDGMAQVKALAEEGVGQDELQKKLAGTYTDLVNVGEQFGLSEAAAKNLAREILGVPDGVDIKTWMDSQARLEAEKTKSAVDGIPNQKNIAVTAETSAFWQAISGITGNPILGTVGIAVQAAKAGGKATGGAIHGPGTGTSDDVPAWLSNGEHVLTAAEVQKMGGQDAVYRFRDQLMAGSVPKFAAGGAVGQRQYRVEQLQELLLDAARQQTYLTVDDSLSSAYSFSDRLRSVANSGNVPTQRAALMNRADSGDTLLRRLHGQSEALGKSLDKAKQRLADLAQVRDRVGDALSGEFSLAGTARRYGSVEDIQSSAKGFLAKVQGFAAKLKSLGQKGYSGSIVQEIAALGTRDGSLAADSLLQASAAQTKDLNQTMTAIGAASRAAGSYVTDAMFKGGVNGAAAAVKGLESQEGAISRAMLKIGLGMENALRSALGGRPIKRATGGAVYGPGTGTSDDVEALLSNGEHVFTAHEVGLMGGQQAVYRFRSGLRNGALPAYATGGAVGSFAASSQVMPRFHAPREAPLAPAKNVEQHFHGVMDPMAVAVYSARLQEG